MCAKEEEKSDGASAKSESKGGLYNSELTTPTTTVVNLSCGGILLLLL